MNKNFSKMLLVIGILILLWVIVFPILKIDVIIMKQIYPKKYEEYVDQYAKEKEIDPLLVFAIIKTESNFNPQANSQSGARGLMQLMENTAIEIGNNIINGESIEKSIDIYHPETNIKLGTYYFSTLIDKYQNEGVALAAYNAGMGRVTEWIENKVIKADGSDLENIPYQETNMYVRKVLNYYKIYQKLYSK